MGIIQSGIAGPATGKIGSVTSYLRNGKNIVRIASNRGKVKPTPARLSQREKISVCTAFAKSFSGTGFFNATFPAYGHRGSGYNRAMSHLLNLAIKGSYPGQELVFENIVVARGPLPPAMNALASALGDGKITFSWTDNSGEGTARPGDQAIIVAYDLQTRQAIFSLEGGNRAAGTATLDTTPFVSDEIATWMSFRNGNGDVADSVFTGMVVL